MRKTSKILFFGLAAPSILGVVAAMTAGLNKNAFQVGATNVASLVEANLAKVCSFDAGSWNFKAIGFDTNPALPDQSVWASKQTTYSYNKYLTLTDPYGKTSNVTSLFNFGTRVFFNYNDINVKGYVFDIAADTNFAGDNEEDDKDINLHFTNEQKYICKLENGALGDWAPFIKPTSFTLPETEKTLSVGDSYQLSPVIATTEENPLVFYKSSDTNVATVDDNGLVKVQGQGESTVTAYCNQMTASVKITVATGETITGISITTENKTLHVGQGNDWKLWLKDVKAVKTLEDGNQVNLPVTEDMLSGTVTASTIGVYDLTLTYKGFTDTLKVSIEELPALKWSDPGAMAGVDGTGWGGCFQIVVNTEEDIHQYINLRSEQIQDIKEHILVNGSPMDITGVKNLGGARYIIYGQYKPNNNDVVTLKKGLRIYRYTGTANGNHDPNGDGGFYAYKELKDDYRLIYEKATNGYKVWENKATDITVSAPKTYLSVGEALQLSVKFTPEGSFGIVEWSVDAPEIAKIDSDGLVTGLKEGKVKVQAKLGDKTKTLELLVNPAKDIKGIALVNGPKEYYRPVGADTNFVPIATKGKFIFEDDSYSPDFDLKPSNFVSTTIDTSKAASLEVEVNYKDGEKTYPIKVKVKVYDYVSEKVKEVAIVDWFDYCVFIQCDKTATNMANLTDGQTSKYYQDHISWKHKDGTKVSFGAFVLGGQIALMPEFNYKDGQKIVNKDNYETLYQKGDIITISEGTAYLKWTGEIFDQGGKSSPIEGTGELIEEGKFFKEVSYRYGAGGWMSYVPTTELIAKSDSVEVEVGKTIRSGISRGPEGATTGTLTFASSDVSIAKVSVTGNITGVKAGKCTVTATWTDEDNPNKTLTKTITVTVKNSNSSSEQNDSTPSSSEEPTPTPDNKHKGGCGGTIVGVSSISLLALGGAAIAIALKRKSKKEDK